MFRRAKRREQDRERIVEQCTEEVLRLQRDVVRLENALQRVMAATNTAPEDDMAAAESDSTREPMPDFAHAWASTSSTQSGMDRFFAVSQVDVRARRWLLAPA